MERGGTEEAQAGKHEEGVQMNEKIKDILKKHKDWLEGESDGERANLIDFANRFHRVNECGEVDENDR